MMQEQEQSALTPQEQAIELNIPQYAPVQTTMQVSPTSWLVNILGELKRTKRPWRLAEDTRAVMLIGEMALDLSIATLPPQGVLEVFMGIGELKITVPRDVYVSVRAALAIGGVCIDGEKREGIFCFTQEEIQPAAAGSGAVPQLEIRVSGLIGEVKINQVDRAAIAGQIQPGNERNALPQPKWE
jgi:predicted membrane protein